LQPARRMVCGMHCRTLSVALALIATTTIPDEVAGAGTPPPSEPPSGPFVVRIDGGAFHWSDAAIGAAGGFGAALVIAGGISLRRSVAVAARQLESHDDGDRT
jgi:hypothetical protein